MTDIQSMMLAVCFGSVVGFLVGDIIILVKFAIERRREKKRICKETENKQ